MNPLVRTESNVDSTARATAFGSYAVVAAVALATRLPWLGHLGLRGDEDISTLAARGIASSGWPVLPSGNLYWRGPLYHYLIAPLASLQIDWVPRVLSVVASVATAVLLVRLGRRWFDDRVALVGGLLFALSLVEVHLARQVRMYALYQLVALVALASLYRYWRAPSLRWGLLSTAVVALSMGVHLIGVTLAVLILAGVVRAPRARVAFAASGTVTGLVLLSKLQQSWVGESMRGGLVTIENQAVGSAPNAVPDPAEAVLGVQPLEFALQVLGPIGLIATAILGGLIGTYLACGSNRDRTGWERVAGIGLVAAPLVLAAGQQIGLAVALWILLLVYRDSLFSDAAGRRVLVQSGAIIVAAALVWGVVALAGGHGAKDVLFALCGRSLGRFLRLLVVWPPAITLPASLGAGAILAATWRGRSSEAARFLVATIVSIVTVRSILTSKVTTRYLVDLWPLWDLLAGWAIVHAVAWVGDLRAPGTRALRLGTATLLSAALVLLAPGTGLGSTLTYLQRPYGPPPESVRRATGYTADQRGAWEWLRSRVKSGDRIVATDWLSTYCYTNQVDGWIDSLQYQRQSMLVDGVVRDLYLHAEVLPDVESIRAFGAIGRVWIVAGGAELTDPEAKLDASVLNWLNGLAPRFVASDGHTAVHRLDPPAMSRLRTARRE